MYSLENFRETLQNHEDIIFCYGTIISDLNKIICSARSAHTKAATNYEFEITIIGDITKNILENTYHPVFKLNSISHNFSILKVKDQYYGVGGASMPSYIVAAHTGRPGPANYAGIGEYKDGLYLLKSKNCKQWTSPVKIIDRDWGKKNECCCFDSQPSLLFDSSSNLYHLYCRWNPIAQVRKLQVFITDNIDNWKNNAQEIKVDKQIYIYTASVFKHQNIFLAVVRYYTNITKWQKEHTKIALLSSDDGINFIFCKDIVENYEYFKHGDVTQGHRIVDNKLIIYLLCQNGKLNEYCIEI